MMALVPSRHYPTSFFDSFRSSFSKFHGTSLHVRSIQLCSKPISLYSCSRGFCGCNWINIWNEQNKQSRPKPPQAALDYRSSENGSSAMYAKSSGDGSGSTMERIVEKLKNFGYMDDTGENKKKEPKMVIERGSVEDIFYMEEGMLPNARGGFSSESPLGEVSLFKSNGEVRFPWEKPREEEGTEKWSARRKSRYSLAELTLPESELRRLKNLTFRTKSKTKIKGSGVTQQVVDMIHEKWKTSEIVRLKIEGAPALNMKRMHEILERKTGGLVIWRSGTSVSLYRGVSYEVPSVTLNKKVYVRKEISASSLGAVTGDKIIKDPSNLNMHNSQEDSGGDREQNNSTESSPDAKYVDEVDKLLNELGPRYTDWPGCDPLPVDADMLPGVVPGYKPPLRVLPYGVRSTLGQNEATLLRRLARALPPHFALGRNRQLQGLAMAMIRLWEKCSIAKIALKRGVQLTTSEKMAEEIKKLTGGMLLSRNKDFLVFYRGKDFLSPEVTEALLERERLTKSLQDKEEEARLRASAFVLPTVETDMQAGAAGTLNETLDADARWGKKLDDHHKEKVTREAKMMRHADLVRKLEHKLALAERKLLKGERALAKVEESLKPVEQQADPESITDEERFMFRKLGLRMKAFLLLGRRGVFDGTIENMHLHWKYRELVKIIVKAKSFDIVKRIALALEAESGGILVSVDKVSKGYAIIVFRGKDYKRPPTLRPKNLLTKRKALARSIELQRREALLNHISTLESRVSELRSELEQLEMEKDQGNEVLYDRLDSAYQTEEEDTEDEDDMTYLETYNSENDSVAETDNSVHGLHMETNISCNAQSTESVADPDIQNQRAHVESNVP